MNFVEGKLPVKTGLDSHMDASQISSVLTTTPVSTQCSTPNSRKRRFSHNDKIVSNLAKIVIDMNKNKEGNVLVQKKKVSLIDTNNYIIIRKEINVMKEELQQTIDFDEKDLLLASIQELIKTRDFF